MSDLTPAPTRLLVDPIDPDADGSYALDRERKAINQAIDEATDDYNALVDPFNELRHAVRDDPANQEYVERLAETTERLAAARMAMDAAKELRMVFLMRRLRTSDGSPLEDALDRVSLNQMKALLDGVMYQLIVPN